MLRLTRKVEYALIALQYMAVRPGVVLSSKEIAECCGLSPELVAKVMGSLARGGIARAHHGVHGGFVLERDPSSISLNDVIRAVEGYSVHLVQCEDEHGQPCAIEQRCTIRSPLVVLQAQVERIFDTVTIADLLGMPTVELELPNGH
jgi:Rrf2 family protein